MTVDTSAEAVERLAAIHECGASECLGHPEHFQKQVIVPEVAADHLFRTAATLRALLAERDAAREALAEWKDEPPGGISKGGVLYLSPERVAALLDAERREGEAKEREACAEVCDARARDLRLHDRTRLASGMCAAAIRARGGA